jgi:ABC-type dipeptide/oligopeptide/nickel transport system permease component
VRHLLLPALVLGFASSGAIARVVQFGLTESLQAPYVLAARARGLAPGLRLLWHALRPVLPPVISLGALEAAYLFGGTVVTETVFSRPGLGRLLVSAILQGDYPIAQGLVALAALFYTASHLLADGAAMALDPRLRRQA